MSRYLAETSLFQYCSIRSSSSSNNNSSLNRCSSSMRNTSNTVTISNTNSRRHSSNSNSNSAQTSNVVEAVKKPDEYSKEFLAHLKVRLICFD